MNALPTPPSFKRVDAPHLAATALVRVDLTAGPDYPGHETASPIRIAYSLQVQREPNISPLARQVLLTCQLGADQDGRTLAYAGSTTSLAAYTFLETAGFSPEQMDRIAAWSGASILIGMCRAHVQMFTAAGPYHPVLLGPVIAGQVVARAMVGNLPDGSTVPLYPKSEAAADADKPEKAAPAVKRVRRVRRTQKPKAD